MGARRATGRVRQYDHAADRQRGVVGLRAPDVGADEQADQSIGRVVEVPARVVFHAASIAGV